MNVGYLTSVTFEGLDLTPYPREPEDALERLKAYCLKDVKAEGELHNMKLIAGNQTQARRWRKAYGPDMPIYIQGRIGEPAAEFTE